MKKLIHLLRNMSFSLKILFIVLLTVVPMVAITFISMGELAHSTEERQLYLIGNNYAQVLSTLSEKMAAIHDASTLITVSEQVNRAIADADRTDIRSQLSAFEQVSAYARIVEMGDNQTSIYFFLNDEYLVVQDRSTRYRPISSIQGTAWGKTLSDNQGHPVWVYVDESVERGKSSLALARQLMDQNDYTQTLGVVLVTLDEKEVQHILGNALPGQYIGICTGEGAIYSDNGVSLPEGYTISVRDTGGVFVKMVWEDVPYLLCAHELNDTGLFLVSLLPEELVSEEVVFAQRRVMVFYVIVFLIMASLLVPATSAMMKGIRQLRRQLSDVPKQGLRKLKHTNQGDEIGRLITAYNGMVDEMHHMLHVQYDLGRAKAGAELKALQSQINPHFLYNTLDMVSWMAKRQETDNIQQVMQALSQFYKLTLSGGRDVITLGEEIRLCDAYMSIQQLRWVGAIDYMVEADDELLSACIPKITLQPLIENAIKHGIMQRGEARGSIIVSAIPETIGGRPYMTLSVLDNGVGMQDCQQEKDKGSGSHYGMKNIEMRLSLYYEEAIHIQLDSEVDLGTCVSLTLPVIIQEEDTKHEA